MSTAALARALVVTSTCAATALLVTMPYDASATTPSPVTVVAVAPGPAGAGLTAGTGSVVAAGTACTIVGTSGNDVLHGTAGADVICAGAGNDVVYGLGGDDTLYGGTGRDRLIGGSGNDVLVGGADADTLDGGTGVDTASYVDHRTPVTADLDGRRDDGSAREFDLITTSVERLTGGVASDVLTGSSASNVLDGGPGNDRLYGLGGNDVLLGGSGSDTLDGGPGRDTASYADHQGSVTADLDGRRDDGTPALRLMVAGTAPTPTASIGESDLIATTIENLVGGTGDDRLVGNSGDNTLSGGAGRDRILGGAGNDRVLGGAGVDSLDGGSGTNACDYTATEAVTSTCRYETDPPRILGVQISSRVLSAGATFTVSVHAADPSGLARIGAAFAFRNGEAPWCGDYEQAVPDAPRDSTLTLACQVPLDAINGTYYAVGTAHDWLDNGTSVQFPVPVAGSYVSFSVIGGVDQPSDGTAPAVLAVSADRTTVGIGATITFSVRATDPAGVKRGMVTVWVADPTSDEYAGYSWCRPTLSLASGTTLNGTWRGSCTVTALSRNATYSAYASMEDAAGNSSGNGWGDAHAVFAVTGANDDMAAPSVPEFTATPSVAAVGDTVTISAHLVDASGVDASQVAFLLTVSNHMYDWCGSRLELTSGTIYDGIWSTSCVVPPNSVIGTYDIGLVSALDAVGNAIAIQDRYTGAFLYRARVTVT